MKKIQSVLFALFISVMAYAGPFGEGMTFYNSDRTATLDFYDDYNVVVYHTNGTNFSHKGEWTARGDGSRQVVRRSRYQEQSEPSFKVNIYLSNRTVTWTGYLNYSSDGSVISMVLNGKTWYRK